MSPIRSVLMISMSGTMISSGMSFYNSSTVSTTSTASASLTATSNPRTLSARTTVCVYEYAISAWPLPTNTLPSLAAGRHSTLHQKVSATGIPRPPPTPLDPETSGPSASSSSTSSAVATPGVSLRPRTSRSTLSSIILCSCERSFQCRLNVSTFCETSLRCTPTTGSHCPSSACACSR